MINYLLILEKGPTSWGAYCPDIPGCVAAAETESEVRELYKGALQAWIESAREDNDLVPEPCAETDTLTLALPGLPPRRYLTILQPTPIGSWLVSAADVPDLTLEFSERAEALRLLHSALQRHLETLCENGEALPEPTSKAATVSVYLTELPVAA